MREYSAFFLIALLVAAAVAFGLYLQRNSWKSRYKRSQAKDRKDRENR